MNRANFLQMLFCSPAVALTGLVRKEAVPIPPVQNGDPLNAAFFNQIIDRVNELSEAKR